MGIDKDKEGPFSKGCTVIPRSGYSQTLFRLEKANLRIVCLLDKLGTTARRAIVHNNDLVWACSCLLYALNSHGEILSFIDSWNDQTYLFNHTASISNYHYRPVEQS